MAIILVVFAISIVLLLMIGNDQLVITNYNVKLEKLPSEFEGFKIIQLSDVHNKEFGNDHEELIKRLKEEKPDIIALTGDLVDRRRYNNKDKAIMLLDKLVKIAPVYYITGNHEWWSNKYESELYELIKQKGVYILDDEYIKLKRNNSLINIIGVNDPAKYYKEKSKPYESFIGYVKVDRILNKIDQEIPENEIKILLSHRPELFDIYKLNNMDVVLSGHCHGGQVRLPKIGGLFAPNQGFLPKYDGGKYKENNTYLIVSRGLGNSSFPLRINNCPEIVTITLSK